MPYQNQDKAMPAFVVKFPSHLCILVITAHKKKEYKLVKVPKY